MYSADFAAIYNKRWGLWARLMWPVISAALPERPPEGARWLDLCCGGGALLRLAAGRGYAVTGVDRSTAQLAHARRSAPGARLVEADIGEIALGEKFDVVTCIFDSLNYVLSAQDLNRVLRRARQHLKPAGVFIFDVKTAEGFRNEGTAVYHYGDASVVFEGAYDEATRRYALQVTGFVKEREFYRRFDEEHVQRAHPGSVIEGALSRNGMRFRRMDAETLGRVRGATKRVVYVARHAPVVRS